MVSVLVGHDSHEESTEWQIQLFQTALLLRVVVVVVVVVHKRRTTISCLGTSLFPHQV